MRSHLIRQTLQNQSYGLSRDAFRPPGEVVALRSYLRQREGLIASTSDCIRHVQKALRQMKLLLDNVVSDITGITGLAIIRAILAGERDTKQLAKLRDKRCRSDERTIAGSLEGHYREEPLFALQQAVERYDFYQQQIEKQLSGKTKPSPNRAAAAFRLAAISP